MALTTFVTFLNISSQMRLQLPYGFQPPSSNNLFSKVKCLSPLDSHYLFHGLLTSHIFAYYSYVVWYDSLAITM